MNPEEIRRLLKSTPFVLFCAHPSDGKHLDVKHPELAFLTRMMLFAGEGVADPARYLLLENEIENQIHLASAEMLSTTSPRLAIINAGTSSRSSQPRRGRVHQRFAKTNAENLR